MTNCNTTKKNTTNSDGDLVGIANKNSFLQEPFSTWFTKYETEYVVDIKTITKLKPLLKDIKIKAFIGTWCNDSRLETPVLYKVLETANFNMENLEMLTLNRNKKSPNNQQEGFNIKCVPTFIFYKNGKEINRFVEYPVETMEKDFLKIVSDISYKNPFA